MSYDVLASAPVNDARLTFAAKGLYWYLLSRPPGWRVYVRQLASVGPNGRTATDSALAELLALGYVTRTRLRVRGQFDGWSYDVADLLAGDVPRPVSAGMPLDVSGVPAEPGGVSGSKTSDRATKRKTVHGKTGRGKPATSHYGSSINPEGNQVCAVRASGDGCAGAGALGRLDVPDAGGAHTGGGRSAGVAREDARGKAKTATGTTATAGAASARRRAPGSVPADGDPCESDVEAFFGERGATADQAARFFAYWSGRGWSVGIGARLVNWSALAVRWIADDAKRASSAPTGSGVGPAQSGRRARSGRGASSVPTSGSLSHAEAVSWFGANSGLGGKTFDATFARVDADTGVELAPGEQPASGRHLWTFRATALVPARSGTQAAAGTRGHESRQRAA